MAIIPALVAQKECQGRIYAYLKPHSLDYDQAKSQNHRSSILSSEDEEIIRVARECGCEVPFKRPVELANDDTPGIEPVIHVLNTLKKVWFLVLLQPTSPLRTIEDTDGCIQYCIKTDHVHVSVTEAQQSPY